MIEINLIREKALTKSFSDRITRIVTIGVIAAALIFITLIAYYVNLNLKTKQQKEELRKLKSEISLIADRYGIVQWQSGWETLNKKVKILEKVFTDRLEYTSKLTHIGRLLPDEMHIQNVFSDYESRILSVDVLTLSGEQAQERIDKYIDELKESEVFSDEITAKQAETVKIEGKRFLLYNIKITMSG